jgi:hypothetical protein
LPRRRPAAAAVAALTAAPLILPGVAAAGAQTGDQALVRVAHFAPGLLEVRKAGSGEVLAKADDVNLAGGTSDSPSSGGRRFALLLLVGGGLAAAAGLVVQQRRSTG